MLIKYVLCVNLVKTYLGHVPLPPKKWNENCNYLCKNKLCNKISSSHNLDMFLAGHPCTSIVGKGTQWFSVFFMAVDTLTRQHAFNCVFTFTHIHKSTLTHTIQCKVQSCIYNYDLLSLLLFSKSWFTLNKQTLLLDQRNSTVRQRLLIVMERV